VREVNEVAARLAEAASDLRRSLAERDFAQARLERLNQELEERVQTEVAARQDAQHRAAHAQRMQALGQLAGGMAHDFNNVLQVVTGSADSIEAKAERADTVRRFARLIQSAALRGKSVTHRLLAFARQGDLNAEPVEIAVLFAAIEELLTHTLGSHIGVRMIVSGDLHVSADRGQLETVLINLATNARDALPDGGTLMFLADPETVVAGSQHRAGVAPGTYVRLSVVDTGTGMDAATLAHSTDPFFTTKHPGQGTGLGLSMARGFAEQSGGGLWIESQPNQGTTVSIWLPTAPQRPAASELPRSVAGATPSEARPSVLLVEDEDAVREVIATQLADAGCAVVAVPNAQDALLALDGGLRVDALVTDLNMPGMNGLDLIRAVRARGLRFATILLTGNAGEIGAAADEFGSDGFVLLHKPVSGAALAERIADLAVQPIK
jgi:signal transduction histidine kinase